MNTTGLVRYIGSLAALSMCAACGGGSAIAPSTPALEGTHLARPNPLPRYATILPDRQSNSKTFEYVINDYGSYATIFDYPKSVQQIGTVENVGGQGCTNVLYGYGKKTFWIVAGPEQIEEFKVPNTPIKSLSIPDSFPTSCAMNTNGDLAVGIYDGSASAVGGDVVIFKNASGSGTAYSTPLEEEFFDGYDDKGDLFADGYTGNRAGFALVELPKGGKKFRKIKLKNVIQFPGSVQWDGTYVTVLDQVANTLYRYTIKGTNATLEGTVQLTGSSDCAQTWIAQALLFCGDAGNGNGAVFNYPAGGSPIAVLTGNFDVPLGVVAAQR